MNRRAFMALAAAGLLPPTRAGAAPPDGDGWPDADPASWPGFEPVGGSAAVIAVVLTWSPRRPPAYRIDFLDLDAPMAPGIVLRGPLDPSGLQIASHVPYGTGIFPAGPGSPESTTLVIDFDDPAAVSVYATQATPRGIAIAARPASGTRPAPTPPYGDSGRSICFALPWVRVDTTRLLLLSRG